MLIVISPAKIMKTDGNRMPENRPVNRKEAAAIRDVLLTMSTQELMKKMRIKEPVALRNQQRYAQMRFDCFGTCALETYDGLQYKSMGLADMDETHWRYLEEHIRILSGLYGVVRPHDSIYPYRLEMQTNICVNEARNLYAFWNDTMALALCAELASHKEAYLISLASKEYEQCIQPFVPVEQFIQVHFYVVKQEKLKMESTQSKIARGAMVRYLSKHHIETLDGLKAFQEHGYCYDKELSDEHKIVFVKRT